MIGLDTSILIRFIVRDDPRQSAIANDVFETRLTESEPGFVSLVALVETAWVLERSYRVPRSEIAAVIERLLAIDRLVVQNEPEVFTAMIALREGRGGFSDALIGALNGGAGCHSTLTFDRKVLRLPGFEDPSADRRS